MWTRVDFKSDKKTQIGKPPQQTTNESVLDFWKKHWDIDFLNYCICSRIAQDPAGSGSRNATPVGESERIHLSNQAAFCVEGVHVNRTLLKLKAVKLRFLTK